jgi:hypothetical protein
VKLDSLPSEEWLAAFFQSVVHLKLNGEQMSELISATKTLLDSIQILEDMELNLDRIESFHHELS